MEKFTNRTGEKNIATNGQQITIIAYRGSNDIDVQFEDGYVAYHRKYELFKKGQIVNPAKPNLNNPVRRGIVDKTGEERMVYGGETARITGYRNSNDIDIEFSCGLKIEHTCYLNFRNSDFRIQISAYQRAGEENIANNGQKMTITAYRSADDIDVRFEDGTLVQHRSYCAFRTGQIANPNVKRRAHKRNRNLKDRTGEVSYTHDRYDRMTLTAYRGANDVDITFDDGTTVCHRRYRDFKTGVVSKPRTGESNINNQGLKMTIIAYRTVYDIDVQFEDGYVSKNKLYACFKNGQIADPNVKLKYHYHKGYADANAKSVTAPDGKTYHSIAEAARAYGLSPDVVRGRLDSKKWTLSDALLTPLGKSLLSDRVLNELDRQNEDYER